MLFISGLFVVEEVLVDQVCDVLVKKNDDVDSVKVLEEVFQVVEKSYILFKKGEWILIYGFDYVLVCDQWLILVLLIKISGGMQIYGFVGWQSQFQYIFINFFIFDYGIWDNFIFSFCLLLVVKYDIEMDIYVYSFGDVFVILCWQFWVVVCGWLVIMLYIIIGLLIGDSFYKINLDKDIFIGNGYYSLGFGVNMFYVIDLVVFYGLFGYIWNLLVDDVYQILVDNFQLEKVLFGNMINFNMGMVYVLFYDVLLVILYQMVYMLKNCYYIIVGMFELFEQISSIMNFLFGLWMLLDYIVNVNVGFGFMEDLLDVLLGLFVFFDIKGLKVQ